MILIRNLLVACVVLTAVACTPAPSTDGHAPDKDLGILWVKYAAEYDAISRQVYGAAERALPGYANDTSWSAMPEQTNAEALPPAVVLDVDETVVSNVNFQLSFERPFDNWKLDEWSAAGTSIPVTGVIEFAAAARRAGVELFFVTNRPCQHIEGNVNPCPQEQTTIDDIRELGIETDADHVMLSDEQPGWTKEKIVRREFIARTHRVIMLIGDDLGDFVSCVRGKATAPCIEAATNASREASVETYRYYWGAGWYILPNPMHGSWTSTY